MAISSRPSGLFPLTQAHEAGDFPIPEGLFPSDMTGAIIVSKFSGWGSLVTILPLLDCLKNRFPHCPIILLTQEKNAELAGTLSQISRVLYFSSPRIASWIRSPVTFLKKIRDLRSLRPTLFIDLQLHTHQTPVLLLSLFSGAKVRVGFKNKKSFLPEKVLTHQIYFNKHQPLPAAFRQVANLLGLGPLPASPRIPLVLSSREKDRALNKLGIPERKKNLLIVNPNASRQSYERRWPREQFSLTISAFLRKHPDTHVILIGSPGEHDYVELVRETLSLHPQTVKNAAGLLTLQETAALLKQATVFITNDSGPLHLALALGTPTVALFGPTHPDLVLFRPNAPKSVFLYEPITCSPCLHHTDVLPCAGDNRCIQAISVDSVLAAIDMLVSPFRKEAGPQQWRFNPDRYAPQDDLRVLGLIQPQMNTKQSP